MSWRIVVLIVGLLTLAHSALFAQQQPEPGHPASTRDLFSDAVIMQAQHAEQGAIEQRRYEQIEIMRRILDTALRRVSTLGGNEVLLSRFGTNSDAGFIDFDGDGRLDLFISNGQTSKLFRNDGNGRFTDVTVLAGVPFVHPNASDFNRNAHAGVVSFEGAEGFYLKGHGIIFTGALTVPFQEVVNRAPPPSVKPLSEWERVRKELHGEKVEAAKSKPMQKHDSAADMVLKVLAENGHNFTDLIYNERVTVALTLRQGQNCLLCHQAHGMDGNFHDGHDLQPNKAATTKSGSGDDLKAAVDAWRQAGSKPQDLNSATNRAVGQVVADLDKQVQKTESQNLALLGDLQMKQGRYKEAIAAYQKALEDQQKSRPFGFVNDLAQNHPTGETQIRKDVTSLELATKLAQAALAAGDQDQTLNALQKLMACSNQLESATKRLKEARTRPPSKQGGTRLALPSKLIISASKELLDQAGTGKISFENFKKAASVEYLNFSRTDEKSGEPRSK